MNGLMGTLQAADAAPTSQVLKAQEDALKSFLDLGKRAIELLEKDVPKVNEQLKKAGQPALDGKKG
jgi:hypothetical protein